MGRKKLEFFAESLASHMEGYSEKLLRIGYSPATVGFHRCLATDLGKWLKSRDLKLSDLDEKNLAAYLRHRKCLPHLFLVSERGIRPLIEYLRQAGAAPPAQMDNSPAGRFLSDYRAYLVNERGLAPTTVQVYLWFARKYIDEEHPQLDWWEMTPSRVVRFVLRESKRLTPRGSKFIGKCLRAMLRFLHIRNMTATNLSTAIPAIAGWRLSGLPKSINAAQMAQIFASLDHSPGGLRNAAILRLALRLGLRAGEISALNLDDIDWNNGELIVHGKNRQESRLPLPPDVGRALVAYLRQGRPHTNQRAFFLWSNAPYARLEPNGVCTVARKALASVGVRGGAHWLRHTTATQLLQHGAPLSEIGQVLRHSSTDTTAIYAKVDIKMLELVARPWQGGAL